MSQAKRRLSELEATGEYVFHGSGERVEALEPRQAHNYIQEEQQPDGEPAVFASSFADYAIFMAVINRKNCPEGYRSSAGTSAGKLKFLATQATLDQLTPTSSGWVYVLPKSQFKPRDERGSEFIALGPVLPFEVVRVGTEELPVIQIL